MFEALGQRFTALFSGLRGKVSQSQLNDFAADIKTALLDSDVALSVAENFSNQVLEKFTQNSDEINRSTNPSQKIFEIVNQQLVEILGGSARRVRYAKIAPTVILLTGLQGAGKTSLAGKLAHFLKSEGNTPILVAADLQRPNAVNQLQVVGQSVKIPVFAPEPGNGVGDPVSVAKAGVQFAREKLHNFVIVDTAGRTGIDQELMTQIVNVRDAVKPDEIFFVVDAMTGQDAALSAKAFSEGVGFDAVVLTKLDGDARGGAALSLREVTGKPVMFASNGEKLDDFDIFYPERLANRLLDMGDVLTLIEQAERVFDQGQKDRFEAKLASGESFTLDDFLEQLQSIKKMGSMSKMLGMLPGMQQAKKQIENFDDKEVTRIEAIIQSMKPDERQNPKSIDAARKIKIAQGAGCEVKDVNSLINRFLEAQKMMKRAQAGGSMPGMGGQTFVKQKPKQKPGKGAKRSGNPAKRALQEQGIKLPDENEMGSGFNLS